MFKQIAQYVSDNKTKILKRSLIVVATVAGLALTAGIVTKINNDSDLVLDETTAV